MPPSHGLFLCLYYFCEHFTRYTEDYRHEKELIEKITSFSEDIRTQVGRGERVVGSQDMYLFLMGHCDFFRDREATGYMWAHVPFNPDDLYYVIRDRGRHKYDLILEHLDAVGIKTSVLCDKLHYLRTPLCKVFKKKMPDTNDRTVHVPYLVGKKLLTPMRYALIASIKHHPGITISQLARKAHRNFSAVHRDIELLSKYNIIHKNANLLYCDTDRIVITI